MEKNKIKKTIMYMIALVSIIFIILAIGFKNEINAKEDKPNRENIKVNEENLSKATLINIEDIIKENSVMYVEEFTSEEVTLEYVTKYKNNISLPTGTMVVIQEGQEGLEEIVSKQIFENEEFINEEYVKSNIIKAKVDKIVEVGTGSSVVSNLKVAVGDTVIAYSDRLGLYTQADSESTKQATLDKGTELKVLSINGIWYKVRYGSLTGYVKQESTISSNLIAKEEEEVKEETNHTTGSANTSISFDMSLNKPTGLSIAQFEKALTSTSDVNNIFKTNAKYFYYIEQQYGINGLFVAAVGIHESAWGTSQISKEKKNLFGYGAYDSDPYNKAYTFSNYSEGIDLLARVFMKYYLNPKGTTIYDNEKAEGTYYYGSTLTAVNTKYATDKNWANAVYNHMKSLYSNL